MAQPASEKMDWTVLSVIVVGTFMSGLVSSIVNVGLPKMMVILSASASQIQWILTAYLLVLAVMIPLAGYLGDTFGYKRIYCVALAIFTVGSMLCTVSWSLNSIIVARVIQAVGGGLIMPVGMTLVYANYPREKIGQVLGFWGVAVMAAPAIGPTLGGYLVEYVGWRWMFFINVPLGVVCYILARLRLTETTLVKGHHFDLAGMLAAIIGFFTLVLALSDGNKYGWTSPYIAGLAFTAASSLVFLVYHELQHPEPIMAFRLLRDYRFSVSILIGSVIAMGMFGATFLMPLMLQNFMDQSAMDAGIIMFPAALGAAVAMPVGGRIYDKIGAKWVVIPGMAVISYTTHLMAQFDTGTSFTYMTVIMTIRNVGMGLALMPAMTWGMNAIPAELVGRASSISNVIRQISASVGIAMFTAIMQNRQVYHLENMAGSMNFSSLEMHDLSAALQPAAASLGLDGGSLQYLTLSYLYKHLAELSYVQAIDDCFYVATAICVAGTVLSLLVTVQRKQPPAARMEEATPLLEEAL